MYEAKGSMKWIGDVQTFASGFTKREFVVTTQHDKYPQDIKFEIVKDKCSLLDRFSVGSNVNVFFDIRGNEYNGKYYVNLACWKIEAGSESGADQGGDDEYDDNIRTEKRPFSAARNNAPARSTEPSPADLRNESNFDDDDVPF
jgi:hypothetical protein